MRLDEFIYDIPPELIAQSPLKERDRARLMVLDRGSGKISVKSFRDITEFIGRGDCVVFNDTRVIPARLYGRRRSGGRVEMLIIEPDPGAPRALINPSRRIREGEVIDLEGGGCATILEQSGAERLVRFNKPFAEILKTGHVPLPPYISREDSPDDIEAYQTVYASKDGATAAPTAGLHFTKELIDKLKAGGVRTAYVTLHTSYGTFAPIKSATVEDHRMHSEYFSIDESAARTVNGTKRSGGRVFAVGTTSMRVLETAATGKGVLSAAQGRTDLFIYPGYTAKIADGLITNFHLPGSTLLLLVCAFAGTDFALRAYRKAVESAFRFFSYGDAMLII